MNWPKRWPEKPTRGFAVAQGEDHGAEIGAKFKRWGEMTEAEQDEICAQMASDWKGNLLAGYATIHYHNRREHARQENQS